MSMADWSIPERVLYSALQEQWDLSEDDAFAIVSNELYKVYLGWAEYGKAIYDEFGVYIDDGGYGLVDAMVESVDWEKFGKAVANDYVLEAKIYIFDIDSDWEDAVYDS